jgi:putative transposase
MLQCNKFKGTKGFALAWDRHVRFQYMITHKTEERVRILTFWKKHGLAATKEAYQVSERSLYLWQSTLRLGGGKLEALTPQSTAPHKRHERTIPKAVEHYIIAVRSRHPRLGKDKLHALLHQQGYHYSVSTVGRMLGDLKKQGKLPLITPQRLHGKTGNLTDKKPIKKLKKKRRPQGVRVAQFDTIVRFVDGTKRYILTGIDIHTKSAFAYCYTNHGSLSASDFLHKTYQCLPSLPEAIQTDNGSEFAKYFTQEAGRMSLTHYHTYPRSPKMNAFVERFNRTLEEDFICYHKKLLAHHPGRFNEKLMEWLIWYNTERPHQSLGQKPPFQVVLEAINPQDCNMWWTSTVPLQNIFLGV